MSDNDEPILPKALWDAAVDPDAPPFESEAARADQVADWLEQHCTNADGTPVVVYPWQRTIIAAALDRATARRPLRIDRPACLWRPSSGGR